MPEQEFKRYVAYKMLISDILAGRIVFDADRFKFLEFRNKQIIRVNVIANITDKYIQDDEKKFASLTLDDGSGQIKLKAFGEDIDKFKNYTQGDTVQVIGLLRTWNDEIYITPEIIKKREPPYLLLRKLETDLEKPKILERSELSQLREQILDSVKKAEESGGIEIETMILQLKQPPQTINSEIKKLLEEGMVYEPRPGKLRYLG